jgi:hypothetical protein
MVRNLKAQKQSRLAEYDAGGFVGPDLEAIAGADTLPLSHDPATKLTR